MKRPLTLTLARISALLFAGFVAYEVIVKVFAQRLQLWCARRCGNTTILVGRGERGAGVLKTLREDRSIDGKQGWFQRFLARVNPERWEHPLVVVDKSAAVIETAVADDRLIAVHADVDEAESLPVIGADHAKRVFVVTPDDDLNLRVATSLIDAWGKQYDANVNGAAPRRECYVHVRDVETLELAYKIRALEKSPPSVDVRLFSSHELAAKEVLEDYPPDGNGITPDQDTRVHLVIVGFGNLGQSLAVHALRNCHYVRRGAANGGLGPERPPVRVTVVDPNMASLAERFQCRYPVLREQTHWRLWEFDAVQASGFSSKVCEILTTSDRDPSTRLTIALCMPTDSAALAYAWSLPRLSSRTRVLLGLTSGQALADYAFDERDECAGDARRHAFGAFDKCFAARRLLQHEAIARARYVHGKYRERRLERDPGSNDPSVQPWETLAPLLQRSNLHQVEHLPIKLRAMDAAAGEPEQIRKRLASDANLVDFLAELEHRRWCAERLLAGFTFDSQRNIAKRVNAALKQWGELEDDDKELDRSAVRAIPDILGVGADTRGGRPRSSGSAASPAASAASTAAVTASPA